MSFAFLKKSVQAVSREGCNTVTIIAFTVGLKDTENDQL